MNFHTLKISKLDGTVILIPMMGALDRDDLEEIYENHDQYMHAEYAEGRPVWYEVQESVGGVNYFRVKDRVHIPL